MEWSIQGLARSAGTTSRTLRHYGAKGLLEPSRVGGNGYRYYDQDSLVRLQRILLLRELGLPAIADVLDGQRDTSAALRVHLTWLEGERQRLGRQIESVRTTLRKTEEGERLMPEEVFDGFDHTQCKDEVIERWGRDAYDKSDQWWNALGDAEKKAFMQEQVDIAKDVGSARTAGKSADCEEVQAIAQRQFDWLGHPPKVRFVGLGEMYVAESRFTAAYDEHGGEGAAVLLRDAMKVYAERHLRD